MHKKSLLLMMITVFLCLPFVCCAAQEARELTADCIITSPGRKTGSVHDGKYTSQWRSGEQRYPYLEFRTPEGEAAQYLYICFAEMPKAWVVETETDGEWHTLTEGHRDYVHVLLELGGQTHFRIADTSGKTCRLKINEVFVFSEGELPDWVQRWEPTPEKADLLLLVAHPDDELIYFGGTIPTYAVERGMNVVVAYMTYSNTTRRSELLNGLWHMGVRQYPVIGPFHDVYMRTLDDAYAQWKKGVSRNYVTELIRKYKPDVMLTHDIGGEYGHGAHRLCASVAQYCVERSGDETFSPESAEKWGTWNVKKLYLHLGREKTITMDWRVPLSSMGGKTGLELAQEAFAFHVTQNTTSFVVTDEGKTGNAEFSLVYSLVGEDRVGGDFFEHISPDDQDLSAETDESLPEPTPAPTSAPIPTPTPVAVHRKVSAQVAWPIEQPALDSCGYPLSGEHVYVSDEEGVWFYASPTLVVRVDRCFDPDAVITWYEAQVYCDLNAEHVGSILYNPKKPQAKHVQAEKIAKQN